MALLCGDWVFILYTEQIHQTFTSALSHLHGGLLFLLASVSLGGFGRHGMWPQAPIAAHVIEQWRQQFPEAGETSLS